MKTKLSTLFPFISLNSISFLMGLELNGFQYIVYKIAKSYSLSSMEMGTVISIMVTALTVSGAISGPIADKVGEKKTILFTLFLVIISSAICIFSTSFYILIIGIILMGISIGSVENVTIVAISDLELSKSGKHLSIMQSIVGIGGFASPFIINLFMVIMNINWKAMYIMCGIASICSIVLMIFTKLNERNDQNILTEKNTSINEDSHFQKKSFLEFSVLGILTCIGLYIFTENALTYFADMFISTELEAPSSSSFALSLFWIGMASSRMLSGKLYKHENSIIKSTLIILSVFILLLSFIRIVPFIIILYGLLGFFCGPVWPFFVGKINRKFPNQMGLSTSLVLIIGGVCGTISPLLMGVIADNLNISIGFILLTFVPLICCLLFIILKRRSTDI